jgi:hypothetical protein
MTTGPSVGKSECPNAGSGSMAVAAAKGAPSMPTKTSRLSGSILYRNLQKTVVLLEAAAKEWAARAQRNEQLNEESASLISQMVLICLRAPELMRDLWEWAKVEAQAGRLGEKLRAGDDLRDRLGAWLELLNLIQSATKACEAEGFPLSGADELEGAAGELHVILREVDEAWAPAEPSAIPPLPYEDLRALADRLPPPAHWYEEKGDPF